MTQLSSGSIDRLVNGPSKPIDISYSTYFWTWCRQVQSIIVLVVNVGTLEDPRNLLLLMAEIRRLPVEVGSLSHYL